MAKYAPSWRCIRAQIPARLLVLNGAGVQSSPRMRLAVYYIVVGDFISAL